MDRFGRFDLQDGMNIYGALRGIQQHQRQDAEYQKKQDDEKLHLQYAGDVQKSPETATMPEGGNPVLWNKAVSEGLAAKMKTEEFKMMQQENIQKSADLSLKNIARKASAAWGLYQTDQNAGIMGMLSVYDDVHDGMELVKGEDGLPVISEGKVQIKGLNGQTATVPVPPMEDMIRMVQGASNPEAIKNIKTMSKAQYQAYNASKIAEAKHYQSPDGRVAAVVEQLIDPIDSSQKATVIMDLRTGQQIDPAEFAQGDFREISRESKEKFNQQVALKGIEAGNDMAKLNHEYGLKERLEGVRGSKEKGVGSAEANRQLDIVLAPFSKGQVTDAYGDLTPDGKAAIQRAQEAFEKHGSKESRSLTLTEKRELEQAQRALRVYSAMSSRVMERWGGQEPALSGPPPSNAGPEGGASPDAERARAAEYSALKQQYGVDQARQIMRQKYPGIDGGL